METDLCWFGYINQLKALATEISLGLGREVTPFRMAIEGLEGINKVDYPLILFNAPTPVGNLELPERTNLADWVSTDCHILRQIRKIRPETPVIVNHVNVFPGYPDPAEAIKKYTDAGATATFNTGDLKGNKDFTDFLREYL